MVRRAVLLLVAAVWLASCSGADLTRREIPDVTRAALQSAGVQVDAVAVSGPERDGRWPVTARVAGEQVQLDVDGDAGRVTRIELGESDAISPAQLREIAGYASNPSDDRARRVRRAVALAVVLGAVGLGLGAARRQRLREASTPSPAPGAVDP